MSASHILLLGVLLAVMAMRIVELRIAKRRIESSGSAPEPERVFPVMVALHSSMFVVVPLEVFLLNRPFVPILFVAATFLLGVGTAIRFTVLSTLGDYWNVRIVRPASFVSTGIYRHIRHPNYLAVILELPAISLLHSAWLSALFLSMANGLILFFRIKKEEAVLATVPGYTEVMGSRPRFIPRPFKS